MNPIDISMADNSNSSARDSAAAMAAKWPVFIDTNLDTHFLMSLSLLDTVSDFKSTSKLNSFVLFFIILLLANDIMSVLQNDFFFFFFGL